MTDKIYQDMIDIEYELVSLINEGFYGAPIKELIRVNW